MFWLLVTGFYRSSFDFLWLVLTNHVLTSCDWFRQIMFDFLWLVLTYHVLTSCDWFWQIKFWLLVTGFDKSCFDFLWLVLTNQDETVWLAIQFWPPCCYCAYHSHLSQSLPFLRWGCGLSCFLEWDFSLLLRVVCPVWKINCPSCYSSWGYFIFLLMLFPKFLSPNRHFTLKVDSDVCDSFARPT